ncbi:MAG TPA: PDZ domain-containing protein, partial [Cyclobacteriaceae bacterium]|nr:PDZ domain-containing protein [Cyclobacteriaceae bacterium]
IDYEKRILTVMLPEKFTPRKKFQKIPIRIEDTKPYVMAEVIQTNGTEMTAKFLIDTGASHSLMLDPKSDVRIVVPANNVSSLIGRGLGGIITGRVGRLQKFSLGSFAIERPIANFPDPNSYIDSLKLGNVPRNGSIGGEILTRFTVIFDFPNEKIYLKKNHSFKTKFYFNLSGLTVKAKGSHLNTFEVNEVRSNSVSDKAGVKPGDLIMSVNGNLSRDLNLNQLIGFFNQRPGKKIHVEIIRNGERKKMDFVLTDQI